MSTETSDRHTGRVKWFNNKAGYGFVTVTDGPKAGTDVFVHHSSIKVDGELYKYLVQGEYVEFSLLSSTSDNHEFQAGDVSGIKGGKLMCETRRELRTARQSYRSDVDVDADVSHVQDRSPRPPRQVRAPRPVRTSTDAPVHSKRPGQPKPVPPPRAPRAPRRTPNN
jgi:CspA family cold shock protein